ncbi:MAG: hypothetical protein ACQERD_12290 [Campylobacterota bacterium]
MSNGDPLKEGIAQLAVQNLEKHFHSYASLNNMDQLIEYYISLYKIPSFLSERLNTTKSVQKDTYYEKYKENILKINTEDSILYEFVQNNPRIPLIKEKKNIHKHVFCTQDKLVNGKMHAENNLITMESLKSQLTKT